MLICFRVVIMTRGSWCLNQYYTVLGQVSDDRGQLQHSPDWLAIHIHVRYTQVYLVLLLAFFPWFVGSGMHEVKAEVAVICPLRGSCTRTYPGHITQQALMVPSLFLETVTGSLAVPEKCSGCHACWYIDTTSTATYLSPSSLPIVNCLPRAWPRTASTDLGHIQGSRPCAVCWSLGKVKTERWHVFIMLQTSTVCVQGDIHT